MLAMTFGRKNSFINVQECVDAARKSDPSKIERIPFLKERDWDRYNSHYAVRNGPRYELLRECALRAHEVPILEIGLLDRHIWDSVGILWKQRLRDRRMRSEQIKLHVWELYIRHHMIKVQELYEQRAGRDVSDREHIEIKSKQNFFLDMKRMLDRYPL